MLNPFGRKSLVEQLTALAAQAEAEDDEIVAELDAIDDAIEQLHAQEDALIVEQRQTRSILAGINGLLNG